MPRLFAGCFRRENSLPFAVHDVLPRAIAAQDEREQRVLATAAICLQERFWSPLASEIAGLETTGGSIRLRRRQLCQT